jgi:hypothetical protein
LGKGLASGTHDVKGINPLSPALEVRSLSFWVVETQHDIPEGDQLLSEKDSLVALCKYLIDQWLVQLMRENSSLPDRFGTNKQNSPRSSNGRPKPPGMSLYSSIGVPPY